MIDTLLLHLGLAAYIASTLCGGWAAKQNNKALLRSARLALLPPVLAHGLLLLHIAVRDHRFPIANLSEAFLFLATVLTLSTLLLGTLRYMPILTLGTAPVGVVTILLSAILGGLSPRTPSPDVVRFWTSIHVVLTLIAFALFAVAFVAALLFLVEHRRLKLRTHPPFLELMPSLERLYGTILTSVSWGLLLLTSGILIGYLDARNFLTGASWRLDPKILITTLTWAAYGLVMLLSFLPACKGRRTALGAVVSFLFVAVTLWGGVFWSDFHRF